jgi:hypothetical protein
MTLVLLSDRHAYRADMAELDRLGYQPEPFRKWVEGLVEDRAIEATYRTRAEDDALNDFYGEY